MICAWTLLLFQKGVSACFNASASWGTVIKASRVLCRKGTGKRPIPLCVCACVCVCVCVCVFVCVCITHIKRYREGCLPTPCPRNVSPDRNVMPGHTTLHVRLCSDSERSMWGHNQQQKERKRERERTGARANWSSIARFNGPDQELHIRRT